MTNLVILHSGYQIKQGATLDAATSAGATGYEEENLLISDRRLKYQSNIALTSFYYVVDMQTAIQCDYVYLQRADLFARSVGGEFVYVNIDFDDNTSFTSPQEVDGVFNYTTNLVGPHSEDYILETGFSGTERYFRAFLGAFSSSVVELGAVMFGPWFDPGVEPQYDVSIAYQAKKTNCFRSIREITLTWKKVSATIKNEFETYINSYRNFAPVVLYDRNDYIFSGEKCINCMLKNVQYEIEPPDVWTITATFEELA